MLVEGFISDSGSIKTSPFFYDQATSMIPFPLSSGSSGVTFPSIDVEQLIVNLLWFLVIRLVQTPGPVFAIDWVWVGGTLVHGQKNPNRILGFLAL